MVSIHFTMELGVHFHWTIHGVEEPGDKIWVHRNTLPLNIHLAALISF